MAELPGTKDSPIRKAQIEGVLQSLRAKNPGALPGVVKGAGNTAMPEEQDLPGVADEKGKSRLPGQGMFENPEDFDPDPTLSAKANEVKSVMGIVLPEGDLAKVAYAQCIQGNRMVEFNDGLYCLDRGDGIEFSTNPDDPKTDLSIQMTVDKAIKKGWQSIEFEGDPAAGDALWLECQRRGIPMKGHVPSAFALKLASVDPEVQQGLGHHDPLNSDDPFAPGNGLDGRNMDDQPGNARFGDDLAAAGDHRLQGMETADRSGATSKPADDGKLLDKFKDPAEGMRDRRAELPKIS